MTGPGTPVSLPPAIITASSIPAVMALPNVGRNRQLKVLDVVPQGAIVGYGDYGKDPGPLDLIAVSANGTITTLLPALPTEEISRSRRLNDGSVWLPSIDPHGAAPGFLATNRGGTWHTATVAVDGLPVVEHMYDVAQDDDGNLFVAVTHVPDTAAVWRSTNLGAMWTEDLAYASGQPDGSNRFYDLGRADGSLFVSRSPGSGHYVHDGDDWTFSNEFIVPDDTRLVWVDGPRLFHHTRGLIGTLPDGIWSASLALDGAIWLCDRTSIYRLPPP